MQIRAYRDEDAAATRRVFERAVHATAAEDYTSEQTNAWAPTNAGAEDLAHWAAARAAAHTIVAIESDMVAGFSDLVDGTLLDMLYVDPRFGRQGVGSALVSSVIKLAGAAGASHIKTHASLTARPLFERHGFVVLERNTPTVRGIPMTNFAMRLTLDSGQVEHR